LKTFIEGHLLGVSGAPGEAGQIFDAINEGVGLFGPVPSTDPTKPAAYLNYLLLDENLNVIQDEGGGFEAVTTNANMNHELLALDPIEIKQKGYLYAYLTYENQSGTPVDFDDFMVTVKKTPIVQVDAFYPFGSVIEGLSYKRVSAKENKYLLSDRELQDEFDLNWFHLDARMYDAALGRFSTQDPLADLVSGLNPYNDAFNNPIKFNDPTGLMGEIPSNPARDRQSRIHETPGERRQRETGFNDFSHGIERNEARTIEGKDGERHVIDKNDIEETALWWIEGTATFAQGELIKNEVELFYFLPEQNAGISRVNLSGNPDEVYKELINLFVWIFEGPFVRQPNDGRGVNFYNINELVTNPPNYSQGSFTNTLTSPDLFTSSGIRFRWTISPAEFNKTANYPFGYLTDLETDERKGFVQIHLLGRDDSSVLTFKIHGRENYIPVLNQIYKGKRKF